jgi:aspartate dehydrogenase
MGTKRRSTRVGVIGYGFIGANLVKRIDSTDGLELAFVYNRDPKRVAELPRELVADDLDDIAHLRADIVVEAAHPEISRNHGVGILKNADYIPLSVTALADQDVFDGLRQTATDNGTRMLIPHGALVGLDSLLEWREHWRDVTVTFRKHPNNIDFSETDWDPASITNATTVYDGPAREIASLYPRNVNTIISCALATVGIDSLRAVLVADPLLDRAIAEIDAFGHDGSELHMSRAQPAIGVSGTEMFESLCRSLVHASNHYAAVDFL